MNPDDGDPAEEHDAHEASRTGGQNEHGNEDDGVGQLAELYGPGGPPDLEAFAGPLHWPAVPAVDVAAQLSELRAWVEALTERFPHLDHTVIPMCWWRHSCHVEALQALWDHERVSYADSSPGTAGVEWHRALMLIEARLREWTGWSGCASSHREPIPRLRRIDPDQWDQYVRHEVERRHGQEIDAAV